MVLVLAVLCVELGYGGLKSKSRSRTIKEDNHSTTVACDEDPANANPIAVNMICQSIKSVRNIGPS